MKTTQLSCACGVCRLEVRGTPIISTECHCKSCSTAAARLQTLPAAPNVLSEHGGTPFVLYRKDRVAILAGAENFREFRLSPDATTRRIVASCCNTPLFLEFKGGHWLSIFANLWAPEALPPLEMRTQTQGSEPHDVPSGAWPTTRFYGRLLGAWIAMGFKVPNIDVKGAIDA